MLLMLVVGIGTFAPDKARHDALAAVGIEEASAHPLPIANGYQYKSVAKVYYTPTCVNGQLLRGSRWVETWYFYDYATHTVRVTHTHNLTSLSTTVIGTCTSSTGSTTEAGDTRIAGGKLWCKDCT